MGFLLLLFLKVVVVILVVAKQFRCSIAGVDLVPPLSKRGGEKAWEQQGTYGGSHQHLPLPLELLGGGGEQPRVEVVLGGGMAGDVPLRRPRHPSAP